MRRQQRKGTTLVESALVYMVTMFILMSMIVGALGVFRFQEMAFLAREASRYAATHGAQYRKDAGLPVGNPGTASAPPINTSQSPYNSAPWSSIIWYKAHPNQPANTYNTWTDSVYDDSVRTNLVLMAPEYFQCYIGWTPVPNQSGKPDNYPGSRVTVVVKYPVFPEWLPIDTLLSVSCAPMPVTN